MFYSFEPFHIVMHQLLKGLIKVTIYVDRCLSFCNYLSVLFRFMDSLTWHFDFLDHKDFNSLVYNLLTFSVPTEGYCRNAYMVSFSVIVRFVDIEEIVGDSLQFLFIITSHQKSLNIFKNKSLRIHINVL